MNKMHEKRAQQYVKRVEELEKQCNITELWKSATYSDLQRLHEKLKSTSTLMASTKKHIASSIDDFREVVKGFRQKMDEYEHNRMEKYYSQVAKIEIDLLKIKSI